MNNIFKILPIIFVLVIIGACKESNIVNPTKEPVVLFSQDSLAISSSDSGMVGLTDSVIYTLDSAVTNIQLDYYMESSGGDTVAWVYYGAFLSKPGVSFFSDNGYMVSSKVIDTSRTFDVSNYKGLTLKFKVSIENKKDFSYRYVKFKNMKLTQLN